MTRRAITRRQAIDALLWRADVINDSPITCGLCADPIMPEQPIDWDHIHAVALDGPHTYKNIRPVHRECHKKKSKSDMRMIKKTRPGHAGKFVVRKDYIFSCTLCEDGKLQCVCGADRMATIERRFPKRPWPSRSILSRPFGKRKERA